MKASAFVALALLFTLTLAPMVSAAPGQVGGLKATVRDNGNPQAIEFKFPLDPNDPNQVTGDYQYNFTVDSGSPVDLGNVTLRSDVTIADGFITFTWEPGGATATYDVTVHSWDGATEGTPSCTVTIDTGVLGDFDGCGSMLLDYEELHCFSTDADDFGFSQTDRVSSFGLSEELQFRSASGESAWAGVNLGGDTAELRYNFTLESLSEGGETKALMFFSTVQVDVSSVSVGNAEDASESFTTPNTGAFRDGYGLILREDGSDYEARIFTNENGVTTSHYQETWSTDINSNAETPGSLTISPYGNNLTVTLGGERAAVSLTDAGDPDNLESFWIVEYGTGIFNIATHLQTVNNDDGCLYTIDASLGGGTNTVNRLGEGQGIEDFSGEGGFEGDPEFPGLDVESTAADWEMDERAFGYILAGVLIFACLAGGYLLGKTSGAVISSTLGFLATWQLNLTPGWVLIVALALAAGFIVMRFKPAGGAA